MTNDYRMAHEDKASMAQVLMECPEWCDGTLHVEGVLSEHSGEVGCVGSVAVSVVQRDEDPLGAGVCIEAESIGGRNILHADDLAALLVMLGDAERIAARARIEV